MTDGTDNSNKGTMVHLLVEGKYVKARKSKEPKKVELVLVDDQGNPDDVKYFTIKESTEGLTKTYVAFHFRYDSDWYSLKIEGETLTLVDLSQPVRDAGSRYWLEMVNIGAGESHHLRTTQGVIGVLKSEKRLKLGVEGSPVIFEQVRTS